MFIDHPTEAFLTQKIIHGHEGIANHCSLSIRRQQQPAIGQSLVRIKHIGLPVCRQQRIQLRLAIHHQRTVLETVAMIVHITTIEEKGSVLRCSHECIPFGGLLCRVSSDFEHYAINRKNSS